MPDLPDDFVADLRRLQPRPDLDDTIWRAPHLVQLTYGRLWELVAERLPTTPSRVLDVGSGTGVLALEVARAGHDVVGLEPDDGALALARRGAEDADLATGSLRYEQGEVEEWEPDAAEFDVVMTTRAMHHVVDPAKALTRMRQWLRPGGRLLVVDFLYDRLDRRGAQWLAQTQSTLEAAGLFRAPDHAAHAHAAHAHAAHGHGHDDGGHDGPDRGASHDAHATDGDAPDHDDRLPADPATAVRRFEADWRRTYEDEEMLNRSASILDPLDSLFEVTERSWHPYLYWDILVGLRATDPATEHELASRIAAWEAYLLDQGELESVFVAIVATPAG